MDKKLWNDSMPQAKEALDKFKMEVADEISFGDKGNCNDEMDCNDVDYSGGHLIKKMMDDKNCK